MDALLKFHEISTKKANVIPDLELDWMLYLTFYMCLVPVNAFVDAKLKIMMKRENKLHVFYMFWWFFWNEQTPEDI